MGGHVRLYARPLSIARARALRALRARAPPYITVSRGPPARAAFKSLSPVSRITGGHSAFGGCRGARIAVARGWTDEERRWGEDGDRGSWRCLAKLTGTRENAFFGLSKSSVAVNGVGLRCGRFLFNFTGGGGYESLKMCNQMFSKCTFL